LYQARLVFFLFVASLAMFFGACIAFYVMLINGLKSSPYDSVVPLKYRPLDLPLSFWVSTGLLLLTSVWLHLAARCIARERQDRFLAYLQAGFVSALGFLIVQALGMNTLLQEHYAFMEQTGMTRLYGVCFAFSFIHALHVLGGVVFIGFVLVQGYRRRYDHERHWAVDHCAWYWHFLDVVWVAMLVVFVVTR
jgi:heme/copper-type cytochrome/quinol oxidase subunit 3